MTALLLLAVAFLVLVNGFFVAAEFALVRARRGELEAMVAEGRKGARAAVDLLDDLNRYLSSCQFGITLASLGIGFLGEPAIAELVEPAFGDLSHGVAVALSIAVAYIIVTSAHITVGEQVPKIFSIVHAESTAIRIARPLKLFTTAMRPFINLLNGASNALLRLVRIDPDAATEGGATPQELRVLIAQGRAGGTLDPGEAGMLTGVFHLHEQEARQVMTPFPAVVTVDLSEDVETGMRRCISSGHTRLLVTEDENPDRVAGIVHANALARAFMADGPQASLQPLVRDAVIVPETKPLDDLLADLQRQRSSMAVVVDEYGRVAGIVTVEDIIEEVVGEIDDETDPAGGQIRRLANGDWFVRGHVAVTDLLDYGLELPVDTDAYNSVGGFVFAELGRLPKRGDTVTADSYSIRVESVRENRIEAVRIRERRAPVSSSSGATNGQG
ncbi:hemolysin family protein [Conexibacter sp. SYSU D00693]|uniref:hemolysin family protein n=1 Tax=Conexibacter sp. SYSU D00693 TaxID=2812560 RepID=UPI00196ACA7B|nr:hemolysin family protein [Conexibacter sp. SYSU D00693]